MTKHCAIVVLTTLVVAFPATDANATPRPGHYAGTRVTFDLAGSRVTRFALTWRARCDSGATLTQTTNLATNLSGRRSVDARDYRFRAAGGRAVTVVYWLTLRFSGPTRASGTWSATSYVDDAAGNVVDVCRSRRIVWRALAERAG